MASQILTYLKSRTATTEARLAARFRPIVVKVPDGLRREAKAVIFNDIVRMKEIARGK